jgi:predicted  nucleic acid-binding Zn-ribbon protein
MSAALGIYRLQLVDSRMDEIHARLEEICRILENDQELRQAKEQVAESEANHKLSLHKLKQAETETEKQKVKIEQTEASLYSGNVKNPKELQDLQNESASLKRHLETLEERQLEAMLEEEVAELAKHEDGGHLEKVQARLANQNIKLTTEQDDLKKELQRLESERQAALAPLDKGLLSAYEDLRRQRRGVAVIEVSEGACAACGTTLTPAQRQSARSATQIFNCPTCGRILFAN